MIARTKRSSPGFSGLLASSGSLVASLQRWRGKEETVSVTINPNSQPCREKRGRSRQQSEQRE